MCVCVCVCVRERGEMTHFFLRVQFLLLFLLHRGSRFERDRGGERCGLVLSDHMRESSC